MNTRRLMEIALDMAGLSEIPGDSAVQHAGQGIRRRLVDIDPCVDRLSPRSTQRTRRMQRRTIPVLDASQIHSTSIVPRISTTPARRPLRPLRALRLPTDFVTKDWT